MSDNIFHKIYYKPSHYFRRSKDTPAKLAILAGNGATPKQAEESFSSFLSKDAIHEADLLFLPNDQGYKYALTLVDVATRCKAAQPLKTKTSSEVAKTTPLKKPKQLSVDNGKEFYKEVTKYFDNTRIVRSHDLTHRTT